MRFTRLRTLIGTRRNTSPYDNASWLLALAILAIVIPANDKIASNEVFFAAHGVSPLAWVVVLAVALLVVWAVLAGILTLLSRLLSARGFDIACSAVELLIAWFLVGNVLARTVMSGAANLAPVVGLVAAAAITWLARRLSMGNVLVACASVAAAIPLATAVLGSAQATTAGSFTFADGPRPSILWVISDELQYPLAFDEEGNVRDELPNLKALSEQATRYTHAYSAANYTDYAVPSQLTGISDVAAQGTERMQDVRAGIGIVPGLAARYSIVMESPIYRFDCDANDCATIGAESDGTVVQRFWSFAKDTAAIAGKTALAPPFSNTFPSLDGKWRDFWSGGDEFGDDAEGRTVGRVISGIEEQQATNPTTPVFTFWHTIRTHAPWNVDREGNPIYPARLPIVEGAHMVGSEKDGTYTTPELESIERRLYANTAVDFDRQLGELIDELKATGQFDDTMIVVTADHGAGITERRDRRVGDTLAQRWTEVAHVPLVVKEPGQTEPVVVSEPRSTGQIAQTVLDAAGVTGTGDLTLSPPLTDDLDHGPVFATVAGGVMTPWVYDGLAEPSPWVADDLTPPDPAHPFAIGIDPALLDQPVPEGWTEADATFTSLPGTSDQQLLVVDRSVAGCDRDERAGLVSSDQTVIGSVLWESGGGPHPERGWAIVPKSPVESYRFWCTPAA